MGRGWFARDHRHCLSETRFSGGRPSVARHGVGPTSNRNGDGSKIRAKGCATASVSNSQASGPNRAAAGRVMRRSRPDRAVMPTEGKRCGLPRDRLRRDVSRAQDDIRPCRQG
jgi:hypothetical protein